MKKTHEHLKRDLERFQANIAKWQRACEREAGKGDMEMAGQYEQDAKDLTDIYNAIAEGNYGLAGELAYELDTIVRDQIPVRLYNTITKCSK